jgi:hypothetical protein
VTGEEKAPNRSSRRRKRRAAMSPSTIAAAIERSCDATVPLDLEPPAPASRAASPSREEEQRGGKRSRRSHRRTRIRGRPSRRDSTGGSRFGGLTARRVSRGGDEDEAASSKAAVDAAVEASSHSTQPQKKRVRSSVTRTSTSDSGRLAADCGTARRRGLR